MANGTRRMARRSGNHLPLAVFALLSVALLLLGKAQSHLFDGVRGTLSDWTGPALESVRAPLDNFNRWVASIGDVFEVYQENLRLKDENAKLRQWQGAAMRLEGRVDQDEKLLHAIPQRGTSFVLARVIGRSGKPFAETMVLDAGGANGVKAGQAVMDARGMIGRIFLAGQHTSWVILLKDLNSRIPVAVEPGNTQAILAGNNRDAPMLEALPPNAKVKSGNEIVTSGDGGLLPPGLAVGTLIPGPGTWRVALFADETTTEQVEIIDYKTPIESTPALTRSAIPAVASGAPAAAPATAAQKTAPAQPVSQPPKDDKVSHGGAQ